MLVTANGLIIRSYPSGAHDRLVHLLTEEYGRLPVLVKGASSRKSGNAAATQLFTYGNYELYRGRDGDLFWYRGGTILTAFYELSSDVTRMALAAYLCDVAADMTDLGPSEENAPLLRMLLNSLYALGQGTKPEAIVKGVFEWRAAAVAGYMPRLTGCSVCGEGYPDSAYLDVMDGSMICADCRAERNRLGVVPEGEDWTRERRILCPLSSAGLAAIRYALTAPDRRIFAFALSGEGEERAFARAAETYLLNHLERDFETLRFYRSVADP